MKHFILPVLALLALAACEPTTKGSPAPEAVVAIAGPGQDLNAVTLLEEDGCYWYTYVGPVETTQLPLLSREGRHICTRPQG